MSAQGADSEGGDTVSWSAEHARKQRDYRQALEWIAHLADDHHPADDYDRGQRSVMRLALAELKRIDP